MDYIPRQLNDAMSRALARGKSVLLLGPRQTGKSTLVGQVAADFTLSFVRPDTRQRYERLPALLAQEIAALPRRSDKVPLVVLDEVQRLPVCLDVVQDAIDRQVAQFILTGSSARQLRRGAKLNLLPGRVVTLHLDPFTLRELAPTTLEDLLVFGSLPGIRAVPDAHDRETDLVSYVSTYLEEEVRAEALVRNVSAFARFLELAAGESGRIVNLSKLAQEVGVAHTTVGSYFQILEDCLIAERIEPLTSSRTRRKLTRSQKYLIFDLGVRRVCAREGSALPHSQVGHIFEQAMGLELIRALRFRADQARLRFWRDPDGPEIDWLVETSSDLVPIEVKWTDSPELKHAKHLNVFLDEYPQAKHGYILCRAPRPLRLSKRITALPWMQVAEVANATPR